MSRRDPIAETVCLKELAMIVSVQLNRRLYCMQMLVIGVTDQNRIGAKIKSRLNSRNACWNSVQNFVSYGLLFINIKNKLHRSIFLGVRGGAVG
jgi:hypothetical protein